MGISKPIHFWKAQLEHEESENQCLHVLRFLQGQHFLNFKVTAKNNKFLIHQV